MNDMYLVEKRHSTRDFKHYPLTDEDKRYLDGLWESPPDLIKTSGVEFKFIENGFELAPKLEGLAGYFGIMIHAPHYYAVYADAHDLSYKLAGYIGEWFILKAIKRDLGFCWIEVKDTESLKVNLGIHSPKEIVALIAIGYPKREFKQSTIYASSRPGNLSTLTELGYPNIDIKADQGPARAHKSIMEMTHFDSFNDVPSLNKIEQYGLNRPIFYMRYAPSYKNLQPWHFLIQSGNIYMIMYQPDFVPESIKCLDAGIGMLYFEVGLNSSGFSGHWQFDNLDLSEDLPPNYKVVGRYLY